MGEDSLIALYIISTNYGTHYCGITNNLIRRWSEHVRGKSKYLSRFTAKEVVYLEFFATYDLARKREIYIKSKSPGRFFMAWKLSSGYYDNLK